MNGALGCKKRCLSRFLWLRSNELAKEIEYAANH